LKGFPSIFVGAAREPPFWLESILSIEMGNVFLKKNENLSISERPIPNYPICKRLYSNEMAVSSQKGGSRAAPTKIDGNPFKDRADTQVRPYT
jgi:hypothetical protein